MADYRPIKVKMWSDTWFLKLNQEEKLVWIYLLTNPYFHISGIYELPKSLISPFVGLEMGGSNDEKSGSKVDQILDQFQINKKIIYKDGWIFIKNYLKNQYQQINKKDNIYKGIITYLNENPKLIELFDLENEDPYKELIRPMGKEESNKVVKRKEETSTKTTTSDFDQFWLSYPRKVAKSKAQAKFLKLDKKLLPRILEKLEEQKKTKQWKDDNGKYIPHPTTWLNGERWEDEVIGESPEQIAQYLVDKYGEDQAMFYFVNGRREGDHYDFKDEDILKYRDIFKL